MVWTRGWRFEGMEMQGAGAGPIVTSSGGISMATDEEAIRQSLMILLSTVPGERVMRPEFGCPLHRLVFEPNDDTTAGLAIHYVRQSILRFEPRIDITSLDAGRRAMAGPASAEATLFVHLKYRVRTSQRVDTVTLEFDLQGQSVL